MPYLELAPPDWDALLGGHTEPEWVADRDRKFGLAEGVVEDVLRVFEELRARNSVFGCSATTLKQVPLSADWYVSLAGFSLKTLGHMSSGPQSFGLRRSPKTLVARLTSGGQVSDSDLHSFAKWINSEINRLHPSEDRDESKALAHVLLILGGRVLGRGLNIGGTDAVILLKRLLVQSMSERGHQVETQVEDGVWRVASPDFAKAQRIRFGRRIVCEFIPGGDRPDIKVTADEVVILMGEVKGRKDLSNRWESWMPQVESHLWTWTTKFPKAARVFFGTVIDEMMVKGESAKGTKHAGLRHLREQGTLTTAYNISKVAKGDPKASAAFKNLIDQLDAVLAKG